MSAATLSVGIPAFNQGSFLPQTLDSLLAQTVLPLEVVISDHFSTDSTAEVIAHYAAKHPGLIRGVQPPPGTGISGQWNFTASQLRGDWITLFSSDDLARPKFVETFLRGASRAADAVLVRAGWENIDAHGTVLSKEFLLSAKPITRPPDTLLEQRHSPKVSFAAYAVQRDAFHASGGFLPDFESLGDWMFFMQVAAYGAFVYEDEIVSGYRVGHDGDKFARRIGMWIRDEVRMFTEVMPRAAAHAGMADTAWIAEACRANFERYLASASEKFPAGQRDSIVPLFQTWAALVHGEDLLARFAAGERIQQRQTLPQRVKNVLRPTVQKAHALLRSR